MARMFRLLNKNEIEVRLQSIKPNGAVLLLYKDARCDMNILDETVGPMNWKREHTRDNKNCIVSLWNDETKQWISKEDTGSESNTEKEKGLASDSFKRACFNWGIGRELYSSPFIWVNSKNLKITNGKCYDKFHVESISYDEDGNIEKLSIWNETKNCSCYVFGDNKAPKKPPKAFDKDKAIKLCLELINDDMDKLEAITKHYKVDSLIEMNESQLKDCYKNLKK